MSGLVKYPRTSHLPWSPGAASDDVFDARVDLLMGEEVVVTEKRDGENTTLTRDACHARSLDSGPHPSRTWVRNLWGQVRYEIPSGIRVCGENLYARHSIGYEHLSSFFEVFSVWDGEVCLSWDDTLTWAGLLGLQVVPVLHRGSMLSEAGLAQVWAANRAEDVSEGYVVRPARSFARDEFPTLVGKHVRKGHVTTDQHWMHGQVTPNVLRG